MQQQREVAAPADVRELQQILSGGILVVQECFTSATNTSFYLPRHLTLPFHVRGLPSGSAHRQCVLSGDNDRLYLIQVYPESWCSGGTRFEVTGMGN